MQRTQCCVDYSRRLLHLLEVIAAAFQCLMLYGQDEKRGLLQELVVFMWSKKTRFTLGQILSLSAGLHHQVIVINHKGLVRSRPISGFVSVTESRPPQRNSERRKLCGYEKNHSKAWVHLVICQHPDHSDRQFSPRCAACQMWHAGWGLFQRKHMVD